jgi:hypothetical protein
LPALGSLDPHTWLIFCVALFCLVGNFVLYLVAKPLLKRLTSPQILVLIYAGATIVLLPVASPGEIGQLTTLHAAFYDDEHGTGAVHRAWAARRMARLLLSGGAHDSREPEPAAVDRLWSLDSRVPAPVELPGCGIPHLVGPVGPGDPDSTMRRQ